MISSQEKHPPGLPTPSSLIGELEADAGLKSAVKRPASVESFDFRPPQSLPPADARRLKSQHELLFAGLSEKFSGLVKTTCRIELREISLIPCGWLAKAWQAPGQVVLFRIEPLRGVGLLQISNPLGNSLLGLLRGEKATQAAARAEMSAVDKALLEDVALLLLGDWCASWNCSKPLNPQILGVENEGGFIEIAAKDMPALAITASFTTDAFSGTFLLAMPHFSLAQILKDQCKPTPFTLKSAAANPPAKKAADKIAANNPLLDEVPVTVSAKLMDLEISACEILNLKVGGVLRLAPGKAAIAEVQLGEVAGFHGRPGTIGGSWAVELTGRVNP